MQAQAHHQAKLQAISFPLSRDTETSSQFASQQPNFHSFHSNPVHSARIPYKRLITMPDEIHTDLYIVPCTPWSVKRDIYIAVDVSIGPATLRSVSRNGNNQPEQHGHILLHDNPSNKIEKAVLAGWLLTVQTKESASLVQNNTALAEH